MLGVPKTTLQQRDTSRPRWGVFMPIYDESPAEQARQTQKSSRYSKALRHTKHQAARINE